MLVTICRLTKIFLLVFILIVIPSFCLAQNEPQYDEVTIYMKVQGIGGSEIPALVKDGKAYLSISDVFNLIKIKNAPSSRLDSLSGFFINTQDEYLIDRVKKQIVFQGKKIELKPDDLILTETNLYMKTNLFGEVFGLNCVFNMRDLTVVLTTKLELPLIREMKMEQMRNNLKRLKGDVKADTTIGRSYPLFKFGMVDWTITSTQQKESSPNTQLNMGLGSVVAGGEMNIGLNYNQANKFDLSQQTYLWKYANNDFKALRQVSIGKIYPQAISSINGSLVGIQLTNTPTIYRRSFGTYTLSNVTEPGWEVELYVNSVLVDYTKADASGFYKFEVPLVYGVSELMVRMYGPWGEVRTRIENANIPFNFLPPGELEYTVNAGGIENMPNTKFTHTNITYGVSRKMSIGGGYEYFSSSTRTNSLPYISSSMMLFNNLMIANEYTFGVRLKSSLSYRLPSNIQFDMNYANYEKGQKAFLNSPVQERGISIAVPLQGKHFSSYTRLSLYQMIYSTFKTTNASFLFSGNMYGVSSNITTSAAMYDSKHITASTNFSFSFRLPGQINLMPSAQYDYNQKKMISVLCNLQKPLYRNGYLNISYQRNLILKTNSLDVGLRYDFSFMQTGLAARLSKNTYSFSQSARGSLLFDRKSHYLGASKATSVGRGALAFVAYLDLNGNGKRDKNEPNVTGLNLRVNGGRVVKSKKDSTIRVIDLTPYTSYLVELDKNSFQSISWQIKKKTLSVFADPNQVKTIEIPVEVMAEASGTVNVKSKAGTRGLGRVYVCFYLNNKTLIGKTLTEDDGYYSFMGLQPGKYVARMDSSQLGKINMAATPEFKEFIVKESKEGDYIEGLDFALHSTLKDSTEGVLPKVAPKEGKAEKNIIYASTGGKKEEVVSVKEKQQLLAENNIQGVRYSQGYPDSKKLEVDKKNTLKVNPKSVPITIKGDTASNIGISNLKPQITDAYGQRYSVRFGAYNSETDALSDQQKITTTTGMPSMIVLENGVYTLLVEGFSSNRAARQYIASLENLELQRNVDKNLVSQNDKITDTTSVIRNRAIASKVNKGRIINYGPWKIQNNLIIYADSIAKIYTFEPKGSKIRGYPIRVKQPMISNMVTKTDVKPLQLQVKSSIIELNQNAQIKVVQGQQYAIQVGDFIFDRSAISALKKISSITNMHVVVVIKNSFYNLLIDGFATRKEAKLFVDKLAQMGYKGTIVKVNQ